MIVVLTDSSAEAEMMRRLIRSAEWKVGEPIGHHLAAISGQSLALVRAVLCDGGMTHAQAADALQCSQRTIRRRVADGDLERHPLHPRRITAESIARAAQRAA